MKEATAELHAALKEMSREEKQRQPPPYLIAAEAMVFSARDLAKEHWDENNEDRQRLSQFAEKLEKTDPEEQMNFLTETFRYSRVRNTWNKSKCMLEIGLAPLASDESKKYWVSLRKLCITKLEGQEKLGVAPKSAVERRIETLLKQLRVWT